MASIDDISVHVAAQTTVIESVEALLTQLSQMLKDALASNDPAKIQAAIDAIDANSARLSADVVANTPTP